MDRLSEMVDSLVPAFSERDGLWIERVSIDMPLEVYVRDRPDMGLTVEVTAPSQTFWTSVMPVFHRVQLCLEASGPAHDARQSATIQAPATGHS